MARRDTRGEMRRRAGGFEVVAPFVLGIVAAPVALVWAAGFVAAVVQGRSYSAGLGQAVQAVLSPGHAGELLGVGSTALVWTVVAVLVLLLGGLVRVGWRTVARQRSAAAREIGRERGLPDRSEVARQYGARQVLNRHRQIRPDFEAGRRPCVDDFAFWDGVSQGVKTYTTFETPTMLIAPSRVGKSQSIIGPRIAQAPGAVLSTSTKAEIVRMTWELREQTGGPMMVCDPEGVGEEAGLPSGVSWCLWSGCEDVSEALARARVLASSGGEGVKNAGFWEATTKRVMAPLLHAAAVDGDVTMGQFQSWCFDPKNALDAVEILRDTRGAGDLASMLVSVVEMDDLETRANMWAPVSNVGMALVERGVRRTFGPGGDQLDIDAFLRDAGTIYILGQDGGTAAQLILTLVDAVWRAMVRRANGAPGGRMEPPAHMSLDEIGNIGRLPELPRMISEGGGLGIQTTAGFQSLAQAALRYGQDAAKAMWESATQRIVLGGVDDDAVLTSMSRAAGTRTVVQESVSSSRRGEGVGRSYSEREEQVLEKHQIQTMRRGLGCVIEAAKPLVVVSFEPFFRRYDKQVKRLRQQKQEAAAERLTGVSDDVPTMSGGDE